MSEGESSTKLTVDEAAKALGITTGAVRNRLSRGTLPSTKEDGTVYILLPADMSRGGGRDIHDTPGGMPPPERDTLTSELRDRLRYVEGQLEAERQAHGEARRLLAAALERIPPQLEAPASLQRESPETVEEASEGAEGAEPRPATGAPQADVQAPQGRRWWQFWR